jgi:hypothetical protein
MAIIVEGYFDKKQKPLNIHTTNMSRYPVDNHVLYIGIHLLYLHLSTNSDCNTLDLENANNLIVDVHL